MRQYVIALNLSLPDHEKPEDWLNKRMGSIHLAGVGVSIQEVNNVQTSTKSRTRRESSGETKRNSEKS